MNYTNCEPLLQVCLSIYGTIIYNDDKFYTKVNWVISVERRERKSKYCRLVTQ